MVPLFTRGVFWAGCGTQSLEEASSPATAETRRGTRKTGLLKARKELRIPKSGSENCNYWKPNQVVDLRTVRVSTQAARRHLQAVATQTTKSPATLAGPWCNHGHVPENCRRPSTEALLYYASPAGEDVGRASGTVV